MACEEAKHYAHAAATVAVKTPLGRYSAVCMTPEASSTAVEAAARRCLADRAPVVAGSGPHSMELEFCVAGCADVVSAILGVEVISPRRVRFSLPTAKALYRCFRVVVVLAATSLENE